MTSLQELKDFINELPTGKPRYKTDSRTGIPEIIINPKPTPKEDTTYYNNPHVKYLDIFPDVNPAYDDQYLSVFGRFDKNDLAVNEAWVQDEAMISMGNTNVSDELRFGEGGSWTVPMLKKAKIFQYGMKLKHLDYLAYQAGNNKSLNARIASELSTDLNLMRYTLMDRMTGYLAVNTGPDADLDWNYPFAYPAAGGSPSAPVMIQEHASNGAAGETISDQTAHILTNDHDAAKTKDFVANIFGKAILQFENIRNAATGQRMLKPMGNTFDVFMNPQAIFRMKMEHPYNGVADDLNTTIYNQATALGINFVPCYGVDASMAITQDGLIQYVMTANTSENFGPGWVADYMVQPFESNIENGIKMWYKHAWQKAFAYVHPWTVDYGTIWYKAAGHFQFKYSS